MPNKTLRTVHHETILLGRQLRYKLKGKVPQRFLHTHVVYYSQWESRELNSQILSHIIRAEDDPYWASSGASSQKEYALWSWNGCGMACLKMILTHKTGQTVSLVTLGKQCAAYGGYIFPLEETSGLRYKPFVAFAKEAYSLHAKAMSIMGLQDIIQALANKEYVIASVSPEIRHPNSSPENRGGHLVLILGYDLEKQLLYFHNPSGISPSTQEYAQIRFTDFEKFFSRKGILISSR